MERCSVCNGRMMQSLEGHKCMNARCEGAAAMQNDDGERVVCNQCGDPMSYRGLNSWGEPNYACSACGTTTKL